MIKSFYIFENTLYSHLTAIGSEKIIEKFIGFDPKNYSLDVYRLGTEFQLSFKENFITKELNLDNNIFSQALQIGTNGWEHYVEDYEIEYINRYFSNENVETAKKLLKILDSDISLDDIGSVFFALTGLFDISNIVSEISEAESDTIINGVKGVFKKLPITISNAYTSDFDIDFEFNVNEIGEYIDKYKLQNINTVADFLKKVDFSELYDCDYVSNYQEDMDYTKIQAEIQKQIESVINIFEEYNISVPKDDPNQLSLFKEDDIEKYKNYKLPYGIFSKLDFDNIRYAKEIGGRILAWFKSYIFQKDYMKDPTIYKYETLISNNILNPKIKEEYEYLKGVEDFNL